MAQQGPPSNGPPTLWLDLSQSNNPFLRHSVSINPTSPPPASPNAQGLHSPAFSASSNPPASPFISTAPARPLSRNPFLDPAFSADRPRSSLGTMTLRDSSNPFAPSGSPVMTVDEIFNSLDLNQPADSLIDVSTLAASTPQSTPQQEAPTPKKEAPPRRTGPPPSDRPSHRTDNPDGRTRRPVPPRPNGPSGSRPSRPRRNSDSTMNLASKPITEEEMKLIQAKRLRDMRKNVPKRKARGLDVIDQLDCTGLYTVHHDGPFDAVTSHRNRQGSRRAPINAFPEGSLNNTLGGSGPLNARPDHSAFLGTNDAEAFRDYSAVSRSYKDEAGAVFDPKSRGEVVHGDESIGLGTSTFLAGTPAPRAAIEKAQQEKAEQMLAEGLSRKKSLAHRLRNINKSGQHGYNGRYERANNYRYGDRYGDRSGDRYVDAPSASISEENPFEEFRTGEDKLSVSKPVSPPTGDEGFGSPKRMERRIPTEPLEDTGAKPGFISRMKSLKGGRRRPSDSQRDSVPESSP